MSKTKDNIASLLILVAFLGLTAIAAVIYGGDSEQKAKMESNFLWQKARWTLDAVMSITPAFINTESEANRKDSSSTSDFSLEDYADAANIDLAGPVDNADGLFSGVMSKLQEEWARGATGAAVGDNQNLSLPSLPGNLDFNAGDYASSPWLDWVSTDEGGEIVLRLGSEREYKLSVPFRSWLGR